MSHPPVSIIKNDHTRRAVFLDRDGTINIEKDYLHKIEDFEFIPGAPEAIKKLKDAGFLVIVVSNQSGVARGYFDEDSVNQLHQHIQTELAGYGTSIDDFYFCPHHPDKGLGVYKAACNCRKGNPGMLLQASREHDIDLSKSYMVGDKLADIEAGQRAGCKTLLVLTGYGAATSSKLVTEAVKRCLDLGCAASLIMEDLNGC
ncbi:D-glycero-beta-D-manno-heptose 1,7-bisphosphate 7-phosphatase [Deltaproteobacteria bacterium IMCC39524]|nr:D-glycero-beta-D-manno-heptose 1,7-bisphosphate 7-phosphatase [Deltaproteobacteria bacterium IMCC39524]